MDELAILSRQPCVWITVYPKKYAHGFVVLCFVVVMESFRMNSHEVFIHIHQGCFAGTGAIVRLPQCQWSKPGGYGKISQCITTTKHSKAKTVCIFLGIYCSWYIKMIIEIPSHWNRTLLDLQFTSVFYLTSYSPWVMGKILCWMGKNVHNHIETVCHLSKYSKNGHLDGYHEAWR